MARDGAGAAGGDAGAAGGLLSREASATGGAVGGWRVLLRRNRLIAIVAGASALGLVAGLLVGRFVVSPADAASAEGPPEAGLVGVPVEFGELRNDVTVRGEIAYADAVEVRVDTSTLSGPAVVTGQVPDEGTELSALSVALEIAGRPVIVLPGDLPAYRTLRVGVAGPDVSQFKTALRAVGIDGGDPADDVFDATAANALTALYAEAGYPVPDGGSGSDGEGATVDVRAASEGVRAAEQAVAQAKAELNRAQAGPSAVESLEAANAVDAARRAWEAAQAQLPVDRVLVADLHDALELAELQRKQLVAPADASSERSALSTVEAQLADATSELTRAREGALPALPANEVLYLTELPRRVDAVSVARGDMLEGPAMTVSGATIGVTGSAAEADASLLEVGDEAFFDLPDGAEHRAVVSQVHPGSDDDARWTIALTPDPLTAEQVQQLQGSNVRVSIAVGATDGEVLSVPLAALTAGPGGESRVEVVEGDPRDGASAETRIVVVETGLAAAGAVEIAPVDDELSEGDLVVVAR